MTILVDQWSGCYDGNWNGVLTPASFAHPAKVSFKLAERIYQHVVDQGWAKPGDRVLDPFGGIGGFAFHALHAGLHFTGVELESRFVELAKENLAEWQHRYGHRPGWGTARLIQGDSRRLVDVLAEADLCVSSPPFGEAQTGGGIAAAKRGGGDYQVRRMPGNTYQRAESGGSDGNLGNLSASEAGFDAVIGSPPFIDARQNTTPSIKGESAPTAHDPEAWNLAVASPPFADSDTKPTKLGAGKGTRNDGDGAGRNKGDYVYGDSEGQLGQMREGSVDLILGSPPYAGNEKSDYNLSDDGKTRARDVKRGFKQGHGCFRGSETYGKTEGQLGTMRETEIDLVLGSPPYVRSLGNAVNYADDDRAALDAERDIMRKNAGAARDKRYGDSTGNLGAMQEGNIETLIVSSPPYAESLASDEPSKRKGLFRDPKRAKDKTLTAIYGETEGNIGTMKDSGEFEAVVSSPPYERSLDLGNVNPEERRRLAREHGISNAEHISPIDMERIGKRSQQDYGQTEGQLGTSAGDNFWAAAKMIVAQTYSLLPIGGHAVWGVKAYVRKGAVVDFPDQWRRLCEAVGFKTLHIHQAALVKQHGTQQRLDGESDEIRTERKSFFRRLSESKGSPRIDFEVVLCMSKG